MVRLYREHPLFPSLDLIDGVISGTMDGVAKSIADLLTEMRNNPAGVRFADACKVVTAYFGDPGQNATSHKVWKMPWPGDPRVNMQRGESGKAKKYQVQQAPHAIDTLLAVQQKASTAAETLDQPADSKPSKPKRKK